MSVKRPAWGVYDIFETGDGDRLFIGVVTDTQWEIFCREFGAPELASDARLETNGARVRERAWLIPRLAEAMKRFSKAELETKLERIGLPFAPIAKPWDLLADPHLIASGALHATRLPSGAALHVPALPIALNGEHLPKRSDPPAIGECAREVLLGLGYSEAQLAALATAAVISLPAA